MLVRIGTEVLAPEKGVILPWMDSRTVSRRNDRDQLARSRKLREGELYEVIVTEEEGEGGRERESKSKSKRSGEEVAAEERIRGEAEESRQAPYMWTLDNCKCDTLPARQHTNHSQFQQSDPANLLARHCKLHMHSPN